MRLTFVTPLFPPDVHAVALYHKALTGELAKTHTTTALVYGKYPESVNRVTFVAIDKQEHKRARVFKMLLALLSARSITDVYLITNGPSTELPALILSFLTNKPIVLVESDAVTYTKLSRFVHGRLQKRVKKVLAISSEITNLTKPEIHPLLPYPTEAIALYEEKWREHLKSISESITYVTAR
jgi:hypothetical protein